MKKIKIFILMIIIIMSSFIPSYSYDLKQEIPIVKKSQAYACMKDRHASKEFLDDIDFIYDYSSELGIDPSIIIAISAIETGYGKSHLFVAFNNPGGIKSVRHHGWERFATTKDGYKHMINLMATYAGIINRHSYLFNKAPTTEQLGNYYWVENGRDAGYHKQLTRMIKIMQSYPIKESEKKITSKIKTNNSPSKDEKKIETKTSPLDIIYNILNNKNDNFDAYNYIMSYIK